MRVGRLLRIVFNLATALSLALLVVTPVAWVRSYFVSDGFTWTTRRSDMSGIAWGGGHIELVHATADQSAFVETPDALAFERPKAGFEHQHGQPDGPDQWGFGAPERDVSVLGVRYRSGKVLIMDVRLLSLPFWAPVVAFAILPVVWVIRRRRRPRPGTCPKCGYDLRATPERCPECGAVQGSLRLRGLGGAGGRG